MSDLAGGGLENAQDLPGRAKAHRRRGALEGVPQASIRLWPHADSPNASTFKGVQSAAGQLPDLVIRAKKSPGLVALGIHRRTGVLRGVDCPEWLKIPC